jgi:hypothetical protein
MENSENLLKNFKLFVRACDNGLQNYFFSKNFFVCVKENEASFEIFDLLK